MPIVKSLHPYFGCSSLSLFVEGEVHQMMMRGSIVGSDRTALEGNLAFIYCTIEILDSMSPKHLRSALASDSIPSQKPGRVYVTSDDATVVSCIKRQMPKDGGQEKNASYVHICRDHENSSSDNQECFAV